MDVLHIERVEVGEGSLVAFVRVLEPTLTRSSAVPGLASRLLTELPGIARHRCQCGSAAGIRSELADTELPHVLEHVALELMVLSGSPRAIRGETTWDFARDGEGEFRVRLDFDDDLVALGALTLGAELVDALVRGEATPDVVAGAERLRSLRAH